MGRLTCFTSFHRNKGGLAAFHRFLSGGQLQIKAGMVLLRATGHCQSQRGRRWLQPFPRRVFTHPASRCRRECQSCDLHGNLPKSGWHRGGRLTWATWRPLGKEDAQTGLPTFSRADQTCSQPIFPPLAEKFPFKDPATLAGGNWATRPANDLIALIILEAPQSIRCSLIACPKAFHWGIKGNKHLLALSATADSSKRERAKRPFPRESGCCYQLPRDESAKYLAYYTPWVICVQLYSQEGRGGGKKEALDFCPGRWDKVLGEEEWFLQPQQIALYFLTKCKCKHWT